MAKVPTVLHVDDSRMMLAVVKEIVSYDLKLNLLQAQSGEECIKLAKDNKPDIIFIDAIMDPMDGWTTARELKKIGKTKDIPIIMVTGESSVEAIELAYSVGAIDYIVKPPTKDKLLRKLVKVLGEDIFKEMGVALPGEPGAAQAAAPAAAAPAPAPAPAPVVAPPPAQKAAVPAPVQCAACCSFLTWVPAQGWYCYTCQQYPSPQPPEPSVKQSCSRCGKEMTYLYSNTKWHCFECDK